jgi:hypothetical protein
MLLTNLDNGPINDIFTNVFLHITVILHQEGYRHLYAVQGTGSNSISRANTRTEGSNAAYGVHYACVFIADDSLYYQLP